MPESLLQVGYHVHFYFFFYFTQNDSSISKNRIRTNRFLHFYISFGNLCYSDDFKLEDKIWPMGWCLVCAILDKTAQIQPSNIVLKILHTHARNSCLYWRAKILLGLHNHWTHLHFPQCWELTKVHIQSHPTELPTNPFTQFLRVLNHVHAILIEELQLK